MLVILLVMQIYSSFASIRCAERDNFGYCIYKDSLCFDKQLGLVLLTDDASLDGTWVAFNNILANSPMHVPYHVLPDFHAEGVDEIKNEFASSGIAPKRSFFSGATYLRRPLIQMECSFKTENAFNSEGEATVGVGMEGGAQQCREFLTLSPNPHSQDPSIRQMQRHAPVIPGKSLLAAFDANNYNIFHWVTKIHAAFLARFYEMDGGGMFVAHMLHVASCMNDCLSGNSSNLLHSSHSHT